MVQVKFEDRIRVIEPPVKSRTVNVSISGDN